MIIITMIYNYSYYNYLKNIIYYYSLYHYMIILQEFEMTPKYLVYITAVTWLLTQEYYDNYIYTFNILHTHVYTHIHTI